MSDRTPWLAIAASLLAALVLQLFELPYALAVLRPLWVPLLLTDPTHSIPVEINRTGLQTFALGRGDGQNLSLPYLPGNADVQVGDVLVSSALGGRFPAGYAVGKIQELKHEPGEHFMEALAEPAARLNQGRQALLVWSESFPIVEPPIEPETESAPEPAAAAPPP